MVCRLIFVKGDPLMCANVLRYEQWRDADCVRISRCE